MNSTKYSVNVFLHGEWVPVALFANTAMRRAMIRFASTQCEEMEDCDDAAIINMDTGEVLWQYFEEEDEEPQDDEYDIDEADLEMGYNPYMGSYDYDC